MAIRAAAVVVPFVGERSLIIESELNETRLHSGECDADYRGEDGECDHHFRGNRPPLTRRR